MSKIDLVQGLFFGDEGKGKTVQWLCKSYLDKCTEPIVIRYNGGPQAGHTVINDSTKHIFSSFGSGTLLGVSTLLKKDTFIDPICMFNEYKTLNNPKIFVHPKCPVITPYDVLANLDDKKNLSDGSCGKGIFKAYNRSKISIEETLNTPQKALSIARSAYPNSSPDIGDYEQLFIESCNSLKENISIHNSNSVLLKHDTHIYEGAQGLLLDKRYGFMPYCTPSDTFLKYKTDSDDVNFYFVTRLYTTRHGNGYTPVGEETLESYMSFNEDTNLNDGAQGRFKKGLFDLRLLRRVIDRTCLDNFKYEHPKYKFNLVLNHFDCFDSVIPYIDMNGQIDYFYKSRIQNFCLLLSNFFKFDNYFIGINRTDIEQIYI